MKYAGILLAIFFIGKVAEGDDCVPRKFNFDSIVCVCNSTYCDSTPHVEVPGKGNFNWYVSSREGLRLSFSSGRFSDESPASHNNSVFIEDSESLHGLKITVDRDKTYQPVHGFGGAFTDSVGINIKSLSKNAQEMLLQSYFGHEGSRYNLGRIPIGCSDFSEKFYTYDDVKDDASLKHFALTRADTEYKIPVIKRALEIAPDIRTFAAPWTSPLWMKTNDNPYGPSVLKREHYPTYANYMLKFLQEYKKHDILVWGISTGNEPTDAFIPHFKLPAMGWLPNELGEWVAEYLGPIIRNSEFNQTYIIALDDQRCLLTWYTDMLFSNHKAFDNIDVIGVHWYLDTIIPPEVLDDVHKKYPTKTILMTEASAGFRPTESPKVQLGNWGHGEEYILDIIENMRHWSVGWVDWNLVLDKNGGPNWINNFVDAPVIVNPETDEFFKQPMYYAIKHVSRFVGRYSVRIYSSETDGIKSIAFETPSGTIVVILYNTSKNDINVAIIDSKSGTIKINLPPQSIHTLEYK